MTRRAGRLAWGLRIVPMAGVLVIGMALAARAQEQPDQASPAPAAADSAAVAAPSPVVVEESPASARDGLRRMPKRLRDYGLTGLETRVQLKTLDPWDVVQLIEFLAYKGGLSNIVIGKGVAGLTTKLKFDDVSVGDALEIVLSVNNLAYEVRNGIITITTDQEYQVLHGTSFYDNKQVQIIELKYASPERVAQMLSSLKSPAGTVAADAVTGTLILIDNPEKIREMKAVVEKADIATFSRQIPTETRTFALKYAKVEDLQTQINAILSKETGALRTDARTRTLIATDIPSNMRKIESLVTAFDAPKQQVFIEAKMVTVLLDDTYKMGINWDHVFDGLNPRMLLQSAVNRTAAVGPSTGVGTLTYKTIVSGGDLSVALDALKSVGETKILSNPHVFVTSDEEATIKVITDQPYAEATLEVGTTNVVGETIKFIEVGVKLGVTPHISGDGFISMNIKPELSEVVAEYQAFRLVPVVQRSFAETSVRVRDGETVIIGGMIQNRRLIGRDSVPLLGRIPLIGILFRSTRDQFKAEEMVTFLTPRIVTGERPVPLLRDTEKEPKPARRVGQDARAGAEVAVPAADGR